MAPLYHVSFTSESEFTRYSDSVIHYSYVLPGKNSIRAFVLDNENLSSDTTEKSVYVKLVKPSISIICPDSMWFGDTISCAIKGNSAHGKITTWALSSDTAKPFELQNDSIFSIAYADTGFIP